MFADSVHTYMSDLPLKLCRAKVKPQEEDSGSL